MEATVTTQMRKDGEWYWVWAVVVAMYFKGKTKIFADGFEGAV